MSLAGEIKSDSFIQKQCPSVLTAPHYSMVPNDVTKKCIETDNLLFFSKPRPLSLAKHEIAKVEFVTLITDGIVRQVEMVKKSNGSWTPYGDYYRLNAVTTPDRYVIQNI